jgi:hypothetical protein
MAHDHPPTGSSKKPVWAYAYQIVPPQPEGRLNAIRALLDREAIDARTRARTWEGRLVAEEHVTHILIVSDSPEQNLDVNQRVEAQLRDLRAGFSITVPMAVGDEPLPPLAPS